MVNPETAAARIKAASGLRMFCSFQALSVSDTPEKFDETSSTKFQPIDPRCNCFDSRRFALISLTMNELPLVPLIRPFNVRMSPPGSKSLTNRALVLAALGTEKCELSNVLFADDTLVMLENL